MKLVALSLAVLGLALVAAGSCSVSHRSSDFTCDLDHPACANGRTCVEGFCIELDGGAHPIDAPHADAAVCPAACTSCNLAQKSCTIDCAQNGGCAQLVTCPQGWSCNVLCSVANACRSGINCTGGTSCTISCGGAQSCMGITCGLGACKVDCLGNGACRDIACGSSCACDVTCRVNTSCRTVTCTPGCDSTSQFGGCSSTVQAGCNTCK